MKKIYTQKIWGSFLSLFLGWTCANAQFSENFDASTALPAGWTVINGGDANTFAVGPASTNSAYSMPNSVYIVYGSTAHNDYLVTPAINVTAGISDRLTYYVKNQDPAYVENYAVKLSTTTATASAFTTTLKANGAAPNDWTQFSIDLTPYVGSTVYIGFQATSTDKFRLHFDDIVNDTFPITPPNCTTFTSPSGGSTVNAGLTTVNWAAASGATGYKLSIGTTPGGSDLFTGNVTGTSQSVTLAANKTYYAKVVPFNNIGDAVGCTEISFSTNNTFVYCTAGATSTSFEKITNVTFADINNNSTSTAGYEDFTSVTGNVMQGSTYTFSASFTGTSYDADHVLVWIDLNQNGVFTDPGEQVLVTAVGKSPWTGEITIPGDAAPGATRMRVRLNDSSSTSSNLTPCGTSTFGQVEDYTLNVLANVPCTGAPTLGNVTSTVTNACVGKAFKLSVTATPTTAYSYQWQSSTDNGANWNNLGSPQSSATYDIASQSVTTSYRVIVTCTNTSQSTTSSEITITQNSPSQCYCTNAINFNCTDGDVIQNVTFAGINNNSACGNSSTGYSDYSSSVAAAQVVKGSTYPVSVKVGPSGDGWLYESVGVWIDFNQNGVFDSNEYTYVGTGLDEVLTQNIPIPSSALEGNTRMRVVVAAATAEGFGEDRACGPITTTENYGEMEDYTVTIGALAVSETAKQNLKTYPNPVKDIFNIEAQSKIRSVKVFDAAGKQLLTKDLNEVKSQINFSKFAAGVYVVTTTLEDGSSTSTKVIKK